MYINNIISTVKDYSIKLFADDAPLFIGGRDMEQNFLVLYNEAQNINDWLSYNRLKLNIDKTKAMCFFFRKPKNATSKLYYNKKQQRS